MSVLVFAFFVGIILLVLLFFLCYFWNPPTSSVSQKIVYSIEHRNCDTPSSGTRLIIKSSRKQDSDCSQIRMPLPENYIEHNESGIVIHSDIITPYPPKPPSIGLPNRFGQGIPPAPINRTPYPLADPHPSTSNFAPPPSYEEVMAENEGAGNNNVDNNRSGL